MAEQSELSGDPLLSTREFLDQLQVFELPRESISRECFGFRERLTIAANTAAGEIEGDRGESVLSQGAGEMWEKCPVRESLESMTNDDGAKRRFSRVNFAADGQPILARNVEGLRPGRRRC